MKVEFDGSNCAIYEIKNVVINNNDKKESDCAIYADSNCSIYEIENVVINNNDKKESNCAIYDTEKKCNNNTKYSNKSEEGLIRLKDPNEKSKSKTSEYKPVIIELDSKIYKKKHTYQEGIGLTEKNIDELLYDDSIINTEKKNQKSHLPT